MSRFPILLLIPLYVRIDLLSFSLTRTTENPLVSSFTLFPRKLIFSFLSKSKTSSPYLSLPIFPIYPVLNPSLENATEVFVPPPPISLAKKLKKKGTKIAFNPSEYLIKKINPKPLLKLCDILIVNKEEAGILTKKKK